MTDLTDRMRTCAAHLLTLKEAEFFQEGIERPVIDSIDLLIEASNVIEAIPPPLGEPMAIIEPKPRDLYDAAKDITHEAGMPWTDPRTLETKPPPTQGTWIDPGGALPMTGLLPPHKRNPRACPQCDSRANKRVFRAGNKLMLGCPVCAATWEWKR